jgi:hypothetical protein
LTTQPTLPRKQLKKAAAKLVTEITDETERAIRNVIAKAIHDGVPPYDAARMIVPTIGLRSDQTQALVKYREQLIDNGLSLDKVNEKVDAYADDLLTSRAETIARSEIMDALNEGSRRVVSTSARRRLPECKSHERSHLD